MYKISKTKRPILSYQTRLRCYEAEKRELLEKVVTPQEYERRIQEIAQKAGIRTGTLEQYLYCGVMPGADKLAALCKALGVNPAWVLGLSERRGM
ncbi:MAG: helix-turn-helix domain-containing protein [Acutalibacter sp.]